MSKIFINKNSQAASFVNLRLFGLHKKQLAASIDFSHIFEKFKTISNLSFQTLSTIVSTLLVADPVTMKIFV